MYENTTMTSSFGLQAPSFRPIPNWFGYTPCSDSLLMGALTSNQNLLLKHGLSHGLPNLTSLGYSSSFNAPLDCQGQSHWPNTVVGPDSGSRPMELDMKIPKNGENSTSLPIKTHPNSSLSWDYQDSTLMPYTTGLGLTLHNQRPAIAKQAPQTTTRNNPTTFLPNQLQPQLQQFQQQHPHQQTSTTLFDSSKGSLQFMDSGCLSLTDDSTSLATIKRSTSTPVHMSCETNTLISPSSLEMLDKSDNPKFVSPSAQPRTPNEPPSDKVPNLIGADNPEPELTGSFASYTCDNMPNSELADKPEPTSCEDASMQESHSDSELNLSTDFICRKSRGDVKIQPYALRGNVEVFRCPLCSKDEIFSRGHLTHHLQDHQSNFKREDYKHICCFCFSELSSNSSLERHLLTHTNHRPFNCTFCEKAFTTNGNLSRHIRTSHQSKTGFPNPNNAIIPSWFNNTDPIGSSPLKLTGPNKETIFQGNPIDFAANKYVNNTNKHDNNGADNAYPQSSRTDSLMTTSYNPIELVVQLKSEFSNSNMNLDHQMPPNIYSLGLPSDLEMDQSQARSLICSDPMEPIDFSASNFRTNSMQTHPMPNCSLMIDNPQGMMNIPNATANTTPTTINANTSRATTTPIVSSTPSNNKLFKSTKDSTLSGSTTGTFLQILTDYLMTLNQINNPKAGTRTTFAAVLAPYWSMLNQNSMSAANFLIAAASQTKSANRNTDAGSNESLCPDKDSKTDDTNRTDVFENQINFKRENQSPLLDSMSSQVFEPCQPSQKRIQTYYSNSNSSDQDRSMNVLFLKFKRWKQNLNTLLVTQKAKTMACKLLGPKRGRVKFQCRRKMRRDFLEKRLEKIERHLGKFRLGRRKQTKLDCTILQTEPSQINEPSVDENLTNQFNSIKLEQHTHESSNPADPIQNSPSQNSNCHQQLESEFGHSDHHPTMDILDLSLPKRSESDPPVSTPLYPLPNGTLNPVELGIDSAIPKLDFPLASLNLNHCSLPVSTTSLLPSQENLPMPTYPTCLPNDFLVAPFTSKSMVAKTVTIPPGIQVPYLQKKNSYKDAPKLITCPIAGCNQKFPWNSSLKRHILTHTPHKPFACTRCTKSFSTKSNRERHMERVHRVSLKRQRQRIQLMQQTTHPNPERPTDPNLPTDSNLSSTTSSLTTPLSSTQGFSLVSNDSLGIDSNHVEELREDEIISMNSNEKQAEDISNTLLIRAGDPVVEPNPERLYSAALLAVASSTQSPTSNYLPPDLACQLASMTQTNPYFMTRTYNRSKHQSPMVPSQRRPRKSVPNQPKLTDSTLSISNSSKSDKHCVETASLTEPPMDLSMKKSGSMHPTLTMTCPICSASVSSRCLRKHMITHQTDKLLFRCHLCHLSFGDRLSALNHWAHGHPQEWIAFTSKHNTNRSGSQIGGLLSFLGQTKLNLKPNEHDLDTGHFKQTPDPNDLVSNSITSSLIDNSPNTINNTESTLTNKSNSDMKYVSCCVCLHRFGSQQDLQRHMRSHTGERPFICTYCGKEFSLKHSMHRHARVHQKHNCQTSPMHDSRMVNSISFPNSNVIKKSEA